jgi:branched-chain amino acid aminotransferase
VIETWRITPTERAKLAMEASSLDEVTRQLPEGFYTTFRTFDGGRRVLGLTAHLQRLYGPVPTPEVSESYLRRQLFALLERFRPGEARVRAMMTTHGQVYLAVTPLRPLPREVYERGVRVETTDLHRESPRLKSTRFIADSASERKHIAQDGIFEALLVKDRTILEGMTSNFFYVNAYPERSLCTAREDILPGVTRQTVIEIAQRSRLKVEYEPLGLDQLEAVSEAFITSSSRGIVPVVQIDQVTIGQGSPGPITKELSAVYEAYVLERAERI